MDSIEKYTAWFDRYTASFLPELKYRPDEFHLKIHHTYNVLENVRAIADSLSLSEELYQAALLAGLFHDTGRFPQYATYGTFKDHLSVNHGELSWKILCDTNILSELAPIMRHCVLVAIRYHNAREIPEFVNGDALLILKIVRDADKLDIFRVVTEQYQMEKQSRTVMLDLIETPGMSDDIFKRVINRETVPYTELKTTDDFKALQLGWVYDLNFKKSLELFSEGEYLQCTYVHMNQDARSAALMETVSSYLAAQLSQVEK